ncbi:MAG: NAD(P)H-hydrate dehydratase [Chloroflexi bacterium]|nr:NAD(P)H-hydrate dehydratase [Chloroflexota bacterium]
MKVLTADQMQQAEQECARLGLTTSVLMENAGTAVAEEVSKVMGVTGGRRISVLVGPGNNGGDGLVAARHLHDGGARVSVYLCGQRPPDDPNLDLARQRGIALIDAAQDEDLSSLGELLSSADVVVDAVLGTGKSRPLRGIIPKILNQVGQARTTRRRLHIFALDLPSGLNADTGAVDPACLYADYTITLGFPKPGLFNLPGAERAGRIIVADIGIPPSLAEHIPTELVTSDWARAALPGRPLLANKGTFGRVLVAAGSINYIGAAYLACSGAMRVGAGLVTLAIAASLQPILASKLTEVTYLPLPELQSGTISARAASLMHEQLDRYQVLLMGCGLGQSPPVTEFIKEILSHLKGPAPALVLDADALNTLAKIPRWWQQLAGDAILTPHPGEMARLAEMTVDEVQSDRLGTAGKAAREWQKTIVLKGAYTVIAAPDGRCRVSPFANPGLASAGTGDVLSGAIAGLLAQGLPLFDAAALGIYLHGEAGEMVRDDMGDTGMVATDLLPALPLAIKKLREGDAAGH